MAASQTSSASRRRDQALICSYRYLGIFSAQLCPKGPTCRALPTKDCFMGAGEGWGHTTMQERCVHNQLCLTVHVNAQTFFWGYLFHLTSNDSFKGYYYTVSRCWRDVEILFSWQRYLDLTHSPLKSPQREALCVFICFLHLSIYRFINRSFTP